MKKYFILSLNRFEKLHQMYANVLQFDLRSGIWGK